MQQRRARHQTSGLPSAAAGPAQASARARGVREAGELVGLITEHDGVIDGYEAVELPDPVVTEALTASIFRRRSAMPSRRAVLYLHCLSDSFVPEDVACWYTARGFNFYVADLRPPDRKDGTAGSTRRGRKRQGGKALRASFAELDAATAYLRDVDGVDSLIVSAH